VSITPFEDDLLHRPSRLRLRIVPIASTIAASALAALPIVAQAPVLPPFGLIVALSWRLLRPEMWPAWIALPLGLADDLFTGAPLGSSAALWTVAFLGIDLADTRPMWRDHLLDWGLACLAILFCGIGGWLIDAFTAGAGSIAPLAWRLALGILCFPPLARICARLDRWRLRR
jgi:rod shape-determining protein MreD